MDIKKILDEHKKWILGEGGARADLRRADLSGAYLSRADLSGAYLSGAYLSGAYLSGAYLSGADLSGANLSGADLSGAYLSGADLSGAYLRGADLSGAYLSGADLSGAYLSGADLSGADLSGAKNIDRAMWNIYTTFYPMQCPESGAYIGYKKARGLIVKLEITEDALRSSATSRKCRASKAKVLSITDLDGNPAGNHVSSDHDEDFVYVVGEIVKVKDFDTNRWNGCSTGIHHFITREEAVTY